MVRSRLKSINTSTVSDRSTDEIMIELRDMAMESHALACALASEFCDSPAGTVPEWIEKLAAMSQRASGQIVERVDKLHDLAG